MGSSRRKKTLRLWRIESCQKTRTQKKRAGHHNSQDKKRRDLKRLRDGAFVDKEKRARLYSATTKRVLGSDSSLRMRRLEINCIPIALRPGGGDLAEIER